MPEQSRSSPSRKSTERLGERKTVHDRSLDRALAQLKQRLLELEARAREDPAGVANLLPGLIAELAAAVGQLEAARDELRQADHPVPVPAEAEAAPSLAAQRALSESVFRQMPAGVIVADASGTIVSINERAADLRRAAGIPPDALNLRDFPLLHADGRLYEYGEYPLARALRDGETVIGEECDYHRADGATGTLSVSAAPVRDLEGRIVLGVVTFTDITERKRQQEELAQAHQRLQWLMDALPVGVAIAHDPECRVITMNPAGAALLEAGVGENVVALPPGSERWHYPHYRNGRPVPPGELPLQRAVAENREFADGELEVELPSGRRRALHVDATPLRDLDGNVVGGIAVTVDVTELKRTLDIERARAREARLLDAIVDNTRTHLAYLDRDFNFVRANDAYVQGCGHPREELIGRNHFSLFPNAENQAIFERVRDTGEPVEFREKPFVFAGQPERGVTYWDWTLTPLKDEDGRVEGLVFSLMDVTWQVRARQQIEEARLERAREARLFETIIANTDSMLAYLDRDLRFVRVNAAYLRRTGLSWDELRGKTHAQVWHDPRRLEALERALTTGESVHYPEYTLEDPLHPERTTYWDWLVAPVRDESGDIEGLVTSATDLTETVETRERVAAAERARADLAHTLSLEVNHRMKNNLAMVAGLLQMQIGDHPADTPGVTIVRAAATRILSIAAIHEQLYEREAESVDLLDAFGRIAEANRAALLPGRSARIAVEGDRIEYPAKIGTTICVIANELITNAIKYGGSGGGADIAIRITVGVSDGKLRISVWNSGEPVRTGFDPFAKGTMGLRLVRELAVNQYQGTFALRPESNGTLAEVVMDESLLRADT